MSPIVVNGRALGVEHNGVFSDGNTEPIPGGRLWPEAAVTWIAMRRAAVQDGIEPWQFMPAGPRSSARGLPAQRYFYAHRPPPAAVPGTSNHGWGIAVDVNTRPAAAWLLRNAQRFGWSHDEGARVGEWWHFRYVGLSAGALRRLRAASDGLAHLTPAERRLCRELDGLRRGGRDPERRRLLVAELIRRRKRLWREAQHSGWARAHRRERYRALLARTK